MLKKQRYSGTSLTSPLHAVVTKTVASITTGMFSFRQNNAREGRWFKLGFGLRADCAYMSAARAPSAAVVGIFQLPFHREPPQTTLRERCEQ